MQFSLSEQICSNSTAENLLRHFKLDGLTVGQDIILKVKQYAWLGTISAVITANVHSCAGYINVFPRSHNMFSAYKHPGAIVTFDATHIQFENGSLVEHIDMRVGFKRATKWCCKLQIAPFDSLILYTAEIFKMHHLLLKYIITSQDLTSPSRFIIDLSSIGGALQFRNASSSYGLRLYSLHPRLTKPTMPHTGVWDTEAYSAQIAFLPSILTRAAGFKLQVEDGTSPPVCTDERGAKVTAMIFDMHLLGPCAKAQINAQQLDFNFITIYKTHETEGVANMTDISLLTPPCLAWLRCLCFLQGKSPKYGSKTCGTYPEMIILPEMILLYSMCYAQDSVRLFT